MWNGQIPHPWCGDTEAGGISQLQRSVSPPPARSKGSQPWGPCVRKRRPIITGCKTREGLKGKGLGQLSPWIEAPIGTIFFFVEPYPYPVGRNRWAPNMCSPLTWLTPFVLPGYSLRPYSTQFTLQA